MVTITTTMTLSWLYKSKSLKNPRFFVGGRVSDCMCTCWFIRQDVRALLLIFSVQPPKHLPPPLMDGLCCTLETARQQQQLRLSKAQQAADTAASKDASKVMDEGMESDWLRVPCVVGIVWDSPLPSPLRGSGNLYASHPPRKYRWACTDCPLPYFAAIPNLILPPPPPPNSVICSEPDQWHYMSFEGLSCCFWRMYYMIDYRRKKLFWLIMTKIINWLLM